MIALKMLPCMIVCLFCQDEDAHNMMVLTDDSLTG